MIKIKGHNLKAKRLIAEWRNYNEKNFSTTNHVARKLKAKIEQLKFRIQNSTGGGRDHGRGKRISS